MLTFLLLQLGPRSIVEKIGAVMTVSLLAWIAGPRAASGQSLLWHLLGWAADEKLTYQAMLPRAATPRHSDARGYFISYGAGVFREGKRSRQPRDRDSLGAYTVDNGEFLAPLLAFGERSFLVAVCSERPTLRKFFEPGRGGTSWLAQGTDCIALYGGGGESESVRSDSVRSAWES